MAWTATFRAARSAFLLHCSMSAPMFLAPAPVCSLRLVGKACQGKLATSQSNLADEKTNTAALTKQRATAVTAAKGGTVRQRILTDAQWFVIGAATGAVAAKDAR